MDKKSDYVEICGGEVYTPEALKGILNEAEQKADKKHN